MSTVVLIDYGSGNLRSAEKALARAAAERDREVVVTAEPEIVAKAERLVLPGVGAFAHCMSLLHGQPGLVEAMTEAVKARGVPFMGICVGMQLLGDRGLEFGSTPGLCSTAVMQAAKAPTPGRTIRSARAMMSGSSVVVTVEAP